MLINVTHRFLKMFFNRAEVKINNNSANNKTFQEISKLQFFIPLSKRTIFSPF